MIPAVIALYTPMVLCTAPVTNWCLQPISDSIGSLIDAGANGGLAGTDVHMLGYTK